MISKRAEQAIMDILLKEPGLDRFRFCVFRQMPDETTRLATMSKDFIVNASRKEQALDELERPEHWQPDN